MYLEDPIWFSPVNVIHEFRKLQQSPALIADKKAYRKACEMYVTAIHLVGMIALLKIPLWVQLVDDREGTPDIRTGGYHKITMDNDFSSMDVEVVTYEKNSPEGLADFLATTKLSPKKAYDELTTILCHVHQVVSIPFLETIRQELVARKVTAKCPVMIVGKIHPKQELFRIAQIYPIVDLELTFNLIDECKILKQPGVLRLIKSAQDDIVTKHKPEEKHYPFEKIPGIRNYVTF